MNKKLLLIIFLFSLLIIINKKTTKINIPQINIEEKNSVFDKNSNIHTITTKLFVKQGFFRLHGFLEYQKNNNFHMELFSFYKELEIGSNKDFFWFWSKSLSKYLFYCRHEDIEKTKLKSMLYPKILKGFLCIDKIHKYESNENINKITIFDDEKIKEQYVFINKKLELVIKVTKHQKIENYFLPQIIEVYILPEDIKIIWILENTKINESPNNNFIIPDYKEKINLIDY